MRYFLFLILFISLQVRGAELKLPELTAPVMDLAGLMTTTDQESLNTLAREIVAGGGPQITILTVPDLQGYVIEDFSIKVAEKWQLGSKEKDNGLLIMIAKSERSVRIEVGNGIEGEITDFETARYTREIFPQYFKQGQFAPGLRLFMEEVAGKFNIKVANGPRQYVKRRAEHSPKLKFALLACALVLGLGSMFFNKKPGARGIFTGIGLTGIGLMAGLPLVLLLFIFVFGLVLGLVGIGNFLMAALSSGGHRGGGGSFGGGGGWSGGGGGFSGGGSSGSW